MSDNESDEPDDPLLNQKKLIVLTSQYTNFELEQALNNMYTVVKIRQQRRRIISRDAANQAATRYIEKNPFVTESAPVTDSKMGYYTPGYTDEGVDIPSQFTFRFKYGEKYTGIQYLTRYDMEQKTIKPLYDVTIECVGWQTYSVSLQPPEHHVVSLPVVCVNAREAVKNATLTYIVNGDDIQLKSNITKRVRNNIFGDLLAPFVKHYLRNGHAGAIFDVASGVHLIYGRFHIGNVNSATILFLMIGRLRKLGECHVPYDVVKMIASYVWASRYENKVWNISIPEPITELNIFISLLHTHHLQSEESKYNDPYNENTIRDCIKGPPTFDKKI
jgi:hypothetical protein